jgi:hypothetical protein
MINNYYLTIPAISKGKLIAPMVQHMVYFHTNISSHNKRVRYKQLFVTSLMNNEENQKRELSSEQTVVRAKLFYGGVFSCKKNR